MRQASSLVFAACICAAVHPLAAGAGRRHAVVIGISDYADDGVPALTYAEADARAVYDTLIDPKIGRFEKKNVTLLLGKAASRDAISAALASLQRAGPDDLVVIFYAGHGARAGEEALWVTQDADGKALAATSLADRVIRKHLMKVRSQRVVLLLDCCYATSTVKTSRVDPKRLFGDFQGEGGTGRIAIAGSADSDEARQDAEAKSGVFTRFLVQGLRGRADANSDGVVTFDEIWLYVGENVRRASVKRRGLHEPVIIAGRRQVPQFVLTANPAGQDASRRAVASLTELATSRKITPEHLDAGRKALTTPAIDAAGVIRREVYADLAAGRLSPKYLDDVLDKRLRQARAATARSTLAVVPFDVLGEVKVRDAGRMLAERLLPVFAERFDLVDQTQLKRFLEQDDLTIAGLSELVRAPGGKAMAKAVKMRGVRYLVVGTVSGLPDGSLSVTARITDWQTGAVGRIAQVRGSNWGELLRRAPMLGYGLGAGRGAKAEATEADKEYRRLLEEARGILGQLRKEVEGMN